jgi:glycosyltransferase involved in cell wall biosynthesis
MFLANKIRVNLGLRKHIRVIPNGIDLELFDREEQVNIRRKYNLPNDRPIILFAGRMERRKGIHLCKEIVTAILERFEVSFVFAGQDLFNYMSDTLLPYWNDKKLKGSVHYVGKLDLTSIRSFLRQSEIFLLPSLWENCPYSCLEAMAAGVAVLSTDQGGMPELIRDGENGLLAQNGNAGSYVSGLARLIEDKNLRQRLGARARQTIEQSYTDIEIARLSTGYYLECMNGSGDITQDKGAIRAAQAERVTGRF